MQTEISIQLKEWFKSQDKWKTREEFAKDIGIPFGTFRHFFEKGHTPSQKNMEKLYQATHLECFKRKEEKLVPSPKPPDEGKERPVLTKELKLEESLDRLIRTLEEIIDFPKKLSELAEGLNELKDISGKGSISNAIALSSPSSASVEAHIETVNILLFALNRELEFFKKGSKDSREKLRQTLSSPDVGYITALLRALFDEDRFQNWLLMSTYKMETKPGRG